jgi:hypothetical protein
VDNLLSLWKVLAQDMGQRCAVDTTLDFIEVERRVEHEGMSYLTITLPKLRKALERGIDQGFWDPDDHYGMSCRYDRKLPIFLGGFLRLVFNPDTGVLHPSPDHSAIIAVRQLCGVYGKMFLPASAAKTQEAMEAYISTDAEVDAWERANPFPLSRHSLPGESFGRTLEAPQDRLVAFSRMSMLLFHRVFDHVNGVLAVGALTPKHGPGSTADGLQGNAKFSADWTWRLEEYFSSDMYLLPNPRYYKLLDLVNFRTLEDELPVKVVDVPKTQERPRVIAMEPVCMQYAQQALSGEIEERIEDDDVLKWFLALKRQEVNQLLAREGSLTGGLATLDLSEASDRVPNELVRFMTRRWDHLGGAIQACRSLYARVRLGEREEIIPISKFASMGSALTFPLETMIFLTISLMGIERSIGRRLLLADLRQLAGKVAVYGDDIIVPTDHVGSVVHELEAFGFKVNSDKSFWTGKFRESCGKDYYDGTDVSYVKFRKMWPDDRQCVEELVALVSFFNQCKDAHYTETADYLRKEISALLGGFFPRVSRDSAILGEWDDVYHDIVRIDPHTHVPLARGWVIKDHVPVNPLDGERALLKFFLKRDEEPLSRDHLLRSGRSRAVSIKLRFSPCL